MRIVRLLMFIRRIFANFLSMGDSNTDGEVGGEGRESSGSLPTRPTLFDFFSIFARMNFAKRLTNHYDVRVRLSKASMNVEEFVHFSMLCSDMSSNLPQWAILVTTVSKK